MDSQILREIDYTLNFYQARPAVYLAYDRLAFYEKNNPDFRITFDMNIRARQHVLELDKGVYGTLLMPWEMLLMEVKIPGAMPFWMSRILSELDIYPTSYSKYGTYYQNYIEESTEKDFKERGVEICA